MSNCEAEDLIIIVPTLLVFRTNDNERSSAKTSSKKVSAQCSSSTDEGCETDMGGASDNKGILLPYLLYFT